MTQQIQTWLARLRSELGEAEPAQIEALRNQLPELILLDVREQDEVELGMIPGAIHIPRGRLEMTIENTIPDRHAKIIAYCAGGNRSLLAVEALAKLGYADVTSMAGGFTRWRNEGRVVQTPRFLSADDRRRYARHLTIPEIGDAGQLKLLAGRVLLVGAGGIGSPAAFYLAAAGVGTLGIVDFDTVDASNLQRQILHTTDRVGTPKTQSAKIALSAINPAIAIRTHDTRLDSSNVVDMFSDYDVILDGSDNFATRYLVNDACVKLGKPNVHGSVFRFEGQVTVFHPPTGPCYRCLYPAPPPPELAPSCAEAGVLGVLPGVVGLLEAVETIKLLAGIGRPLIGRLLHYDALRAEFYELNLRRDPDCAYCGDGKEFPGFVDYETFCASHHHEQPKGPRHG